MKRQRTAPLTTDLSPQFTKRIPTAPNTNASSRRTHQIEVRTKSRSAPNRGAHQVEERIKSRSASSRGTHQVGERTKSQSPQNVLRSPSRRWWVSIGRPRGRRLRVHRVVLWLIEAATHRSTYHRSFTTVIPSESPPRQIQTHQVAERTWSRSASSRGTHPISVTTERPS